ncbi:hypothetical protein OSTOST_11157 [Ostertagia ostertagi]
MMFPRTRLRVFDGGEAMGTAAQREDDRNSRFIRVSGTTFVHLNDHCSCQLGVNWREAARVYKVVVEQWQNAERDNSANGDGTSGFEFELSLVSAGSGSGLSPPSPRKSVPSAESSSTNTIGNVRKQMPPHLRVRDRLVGLLSASGLRVGLPSAVSVVFSQSELGSTATSTERICTSSQEVASTTSLP